VQSCAAAWRQKGAPAPARCMLEALAGAGRRVLVFNDLGNRAARAQTSVCFEVNARVVAKPAPAEISSRRGPRSEWSGLAPLPAIPRLDPRLPL
jgi:transcriptional regulator of nitric oxide reductase